MTPQEPAPDETPADRLRRAAKLIEQRAAKATPGPWERRSRSAAGAASVSADLPDGEMGRYRNGTRADGTRERVLVCRVQTWEGTGAFVRDRSGRDLDWIAMLGPQAAAPLTALLRAAAAARDSYPDPPEQMIRGGVAAGDIAPAYMHTLDLIQAGEALANAILGDEHG